MKTHALAAAVLVAATAVPASATTYLGATTLSSPTYNRVLSGTPPTGLSAVGTAAHYQVTPFTVATTGGYTFLMSAITPANWDTFLTLYANSFNPAAALTNALAANDDNPTIGLSGFTINLTAGVSYFAVATGFANTDVGTYSIAINPTNAVPEPASWALMVLGFGCAGFVVRRRAATVRVRYA